MVNKAKRALSIILTVVITAIVSVSATLFFTAKSNLKDVPVSEFSKFVSIYDAIKTEFLYESDIDAALDKAYKAFFDSLDDNYAFYYTAEEYEEMMNSNIGSYVGIGVSIGLKSNEGITIYGVQPQSHLNELGIRANSLILGAGGIMFDGTNYDKVKDAILGEAGTYVEIVIKQDGIIKSYQVERREITSPLVISHLFSDTGIGYVRLRTFFSTAVQDFRSHVNQLISKGATSLIIDLRHNTGGQRGICIDITDMLVPQGVIMYTEDKNGERAYEYSDADMIDIPYVILVDGFSASASEVLVGAVKDHGTGTIIGTQTYGKGIVQRTILFGDGSYCQYTYQEYYTPNGNNLHGVGITPDIIVEPTDETVQFISTGIMSVPDPDTDNQLKAAIEHLS
ncbi:MAG: hypothetical protein E7315_03490 [Clostridiales bacterium]|nr:hypothetical protein [Clostridiales bacterium]